MDPNIATLAVQKLHKPVSLHEKLYKTGCIFTASVPKTTHNAKNTIKVMRGSKKELEHVLIILIIMVISKLVLKAPLKTPPKTVISRVM